MPRTPSAAAARIGAQIKTARVDLHWTQDRLAVESGIDSASIRSYENGRAMVSVRTLIQIAITLGREPGYFLDGVTNEQFTQPREATNASSGE